MQLTQFTDYALRAMIYIGTHDTRRSTISEVARAFSISENHLMKVINHLGARGYLDTRRGKGGGLSLARSADLINIGAVVRDTEERFDLVECFDPARNQCTLSPVCALRGIFEEARAEFLATLDRYTLQDILVRSRPIPIPVPSAAGTRKGIELQLAD